MDDTRAADRGGREILGLGVLVVLLGAAFLMLLVEPPQASDLISALR